MRRNAEFWMIEWLHVGRAWWWTGNRRTARTADLSTQTSGGRVALWTDRSADARQFATEAEAREALPWCGIGTGLWYTDIQVTGHINCAGPDLAADAPATEEKTP